MSWKLFFAGLAFAGLMAFAGVASAATTTFSEPGVHGYRLDWCAHFAADCGQPAADLFCQENGFTGAARFSMDPNIGGRGVSTLVFGDGRLCTGPTCSGFKAITCTRPDANAPTRAAPATPAQTVKPGQSRLPAASPPAVIAKPRPAPVPAPPLLRAPAVARPPATVTRAPRPVARPAPAGPSTSKPALGPIGNAAVGNLLLAYPEGADLYYCTSGCELRIDSDITLDPEGKLRSVNFTGDVSKDPHAGGFVWQVTTARFPTFGKGTASDFAPPQLVASGEFIGAVHDIPIDFGALGGPAGSRNKPGIFYVRILPVVAPGKKVLAGTPSNVIKVYYGQKPPPQPPLQLANSNPPYLFDLKLVSFTPPVFEDPNKWGCLTITGYDPEVSGIFKSAYPLGNLCPKSYKGAGYGINSVGDFVDWASGGLIDLWDWISEKYNDIKTLAVDIAMNYTPFGLQCQAVAAAVSSGDAAGYCRAAAEIGVNAGMVALGVPPSIPDYNQLIDQGVDGAVALAADQITEQTGIPCIGPCQDALHNGLSAAAESLKKTSFTPGCTGADQAHEHGREPLCLPPGVHAKPAPGAIYQPPVAFVAVTRRPYDRDPSNTFAGDCSVSIALHFKTVFQGRTVSGPFHNTKDVPTQTVEGSLYQPAHAPLPESMPKNTTRTIPVIFTAPGKYEFPWTHELWIKSQIPPRDESGPMGPNWFTLFSGSTATLTPSGVCASAGGPITSQMPSLF